MEGNGITEAAERQVGPRAEGAEKTAEWQRSESSLLSDQAGSSPAKPELGQEVASEGEALIEAFRNGQPFYTSRLGRRFRR